jgi:hypothetical protein
LESSFHYSGDYGLCPACASRAKRLLASIVKRWFMADANCARETVLDLVDSLKKYSSHLIASEYFNEDYFLETFDKITPYLAFQIITFN